MDLLDAMFDRAVDEGGLAAGSFLLNGYYPEGGWDDLAVLFDTIEEASTFAQGERPRRPRLIVPTASGRTNGSSTSRPAK
ncbi:hypothetical protein ML401_26215 [Bradyrhizobium sp. 62B]|uniref:hypothetical protein n=1 Tax=Bradyrhizobium sp. 62B TaxID=2898442 RepID=UPI0025580DDD|nr:hypothetical protein ML401_26215 [Bradyrhizobium sp. 62B]